MAWSGGTFTRVDGTTGWQDDEAAGTGIEAGLMDTAFNDLATDGINQTINKAGQNTPTANLPMGGYKHTGVANASANDEYTTQGQLKDGSFQPDVLNPRTTATTTFYHLIKVYSANTAVKQLNWSRSSTVGVDTAALAGDVIYRHDLQAYTGTDYKRAVDIQISVPVNPTSGANFCPGSIEFRTGNAVGTALNRALLLNSAQQVFAPGVYATTTANAANVHVTSTGLFQRSTSSQRYKENIEPLAYGLNEVQKIKPVTFTSKGDEPGERFAGLIAEDLDEQGLTEFVVYDDENKPDAIHYGNLVALAFKAIQELEAKVASLEAQLAT